MRRHPLLMALLIWSLFVSLAQAQQAAATLHARIDGERVRVAIPITIFPTWHLYHAELGPADAVGLPTTVRLHPDDAQWSAVQFPEPHRYPQPGLGDGGRDTFILGHEGRIVLYAVGRLPDGADAASFEVRAELEGLTCQDDGQCVPYSQSVTSAGPGPDALFADFPALEPGSAGIADEATDAPPPAPVAPPGAAETDYDAVTFPDFTPRSEQADHPLVVWMLLAVLAGVILNVMPCVLPVVSIKILSFVQQAGEDRRRILHLGLAFAAGIVAVFLGLAAVAIGAGLSWGEQFQSATFLVIMIGVVFAFALSLFGVFELGVPSAVGGLDTGPREGLGDAFFKGMLATVLATPCSGPFLGSTLTWTLAQPALVVFLVFLCLGLGMALPYVVLTANPRLLRFLPKPGRWMETFKQAMGFVLLATLVYLLTILPTTQILFTAAFLVFVGLAAWVWGRFGMTAITHLRRRVVLVVALAVAALGYRISFHEFRGLFDAPTGEGHVAWEDFEPARFQAHLDAGRNVFVDFTADWCPNCKYNERFVFESEAVRGWLERKQVVAVRADITDDTPYTRMLERLMKQLGAHSIPFLAVFPGDEPERPHTRLDVVTVGQMEEILASLPQPE